jgi:uracil-DNA glycosylase family 4
MNDIRAYGIASCQNCDLKENGIAIPFIGSDLRCILIGEAPGENEIKRHEPFVGRAGKLLMDIFGQYGFTRENFLILNSINCRPVILRDGKIRNGKPNLTQIEACRVHNKFYIHNSGIKYIMTLGNYAQWLFTRETGNISQRVGNIIAVGDKQVHINYHPAATIYDQSKRGQFTSVIADFCRSME